MSRPETFFQFTFSRPVVHDLATRNSSHEFSDSGSQPHGRPVVYQRKNRKWKLSIERYVHERQCLLDRRVVRGWRSREMGDVCAAQKSTLSMSHLSYQPFIHLRTNQRIVRLEDRMMATKPP